MARKLKTYQTSVGFFDMAVAAPSMKAALEAWGSRSNLFHQGFAREAEDPKIVAAAMARPGVVLKRPVGSSGAFNEHSDLPADISTDPPKRRPEKPRKKHKPAKGVDAATARRAALQFEREQKREADKRRKQDAALEKALRMREKAIAKAQAALDEAERDHDRKSRDIDARRSAVDRLESEENERWEKQKKSLQNALHRARR